MSEKQKSPPPERSEYDQQLLVSINSSIRSEELPSSTEELKKLIATIKEEVQDKLDGDPNANPWSNIDNLLRYEAEIAYNPIHGEIYTGIADAIEWDDLGDPEIVYQDEIGKMMMIAKDVPAKVDEREDPEYRLPGYVSQKPRQYDTAAYDCYRIMADKLKEDPVGALRIRDEIGLKILASNEEALEAHFKKTGERLNAELNSKQIENLQFAVEMFDRTYEYNEVMAELIDLIITPVREAAKSATRDKLQFEQHIKMAAKELEPVFALVRDNSEWKTASAVAKAELADRAHRAIAEAEANNADILPIDPKDLLDYAAYRVLMLVTAPEEVRNAA